MSQRRRVAPARVNRARLVVAASAVATIMGLYSKVLFAQDFAGNYRITSDVTSAEVSEWGSDCGQRPESHRGNTGRQVRVSMDGAQLVVEDRPRMRSDGCWSQNPRTRRVSNSGSNGRWTTQCASPAEDYQREEGTYATTVEGNRLTLRDRTLYRWSLQGSACRATIVRTMVYERLDAPTPVVDSGVAETPRPPADSGVRQARCALPGPASRLSIVAGRRSTTPGTRVCYRAQLVDADGCLAINSAGSVITWSVARRNGGEAPPGEGGCITIAPAVPAGTEFTITATANNGFEERIALRVVTPEESSSLVAQIIEEGDASTSEDAAIAPRISDGLGSVSGVVAPTGAAQTGSRNALVAILTAAAVLLVGVAFIMLRRKRGATTTEPSEPPRSSAPTPPQTAAPTQPASVAAKQTPPGGVGRVRKDEAPFPASGGAAGPTNLAQTMIGAMPAGTSGVIVAAIENANEKRASTSSMAAVSPSAASSTAPEPPKQTKRCPVCNQRFGVENAFCPDHGVALVELEGAQPKVLVAANVASPSLPAPPPTAPAPARPRVSDDLARTQIAGSAHESAAATPTLRCPTCGKTFGPGNIFCGEDGSRLVDG